MSGPVAVLGAAGFIGNRAVESLHLGGERPVRAVVRRPQALALARRFDMETAVADARDAAALTEAFRGCSHVLHAIAGDPATIVGAVEPSCRAAAAAGVRRLVYLSSASVHGQSPAPGTTEESPLDDTRGLAYNRAKVVAERRLLELRRELGLEVVILRPGIVHGPRSQWIGNFAETLLQGTATLIDGGRGICNAAYMDNVVHAALLALDADAADGQAYFVGDAETVTWAELYGPVAAAFGRCLDEMSIPIPDRVTEEAAPDRVREGLRTLWRRLPGRVRRSVRAGLAELRGPSVALSSRRAAPEVTRERLDLETCRVRLSHDKAARDLGYEPVVRFEGACRRTLAWLAFAGYPIHAADTEIGPS